MPKRNRNLITVAPRHAENELLRRRVTSATYIEIIEDLLIRLGQPGAIWIGIVMVCGIVSSSFAPHLSPAKFELQMALRGS